jgi:hypothetical protein
LSCDGSEAGRSSFLKKRSKRLLFLDGAGTKIEAASKNKSFLVLFFKKEHAYFLVSLMPVIRALAGRLRLAQGRKLRSEQGALPREPYAASGQPGLR